MSPPVLLSRLAALGLAAGLLAAPAAASAACTLRQIGALPVTMVGKRPTVRGSINGKEAVFIVDSGAFTTVLSPGAVQRYGLRSRADTRLRLKGVGGAAEAGRTRIPRLGVGDAVFRNLDAVVAEGAGAGVAGVLGQDVLGRADAEYDLGNGVVRLIQPDGCGARDWLAYWADEGVSSVRMIPDRAYIDSGSTGFGWYRPLFQSGIENRQISAYGALNGRPVRVLFDTGAGLSSATLAAAAAAGVTRESPGVVRTRASTGFGRRAVQNWLAPFRSFALGDEEVRNTRLQIGQVDLGENQMVLGADFFLAHRVYVSNLQQRIYFTYNGGPVFRLDQPRRPPARPDAPHDLNTPSDAAGFARRGAAFLSRGDLDAAIADFDRAIALEPTAADAWFNRAVARSLNHDPQRALADYDHGLGLRPGDAAGLAARAAVKIELEDPAGARADLARAEAEGGSDAAFALQLASLYERADAFDEAVARYDRWIEANPRSGGLAEALAGRCWTRAAARRELDRAAQDCAAALRLRPDDALALLGRAVIHLQRGEADDALADADAAIAVDPDSAWALYGRGLARLRRGDRSQGEADLAAARSADPRQVARARRLGFLS